MRWPGAWKDPSNLSMLKGTAINYLLIEKGSDLGPVADRARQEGLKVGEAGLAPPGVTIAKGEWPGVKLTQSGTLDRASAGPTGVPWVDSNGWKVRLAAALQPGAGIWVEADPQRPRLPANSYTVAVADAAAHGGRWIISPDNNLIEGIAGQKPEAFELWKKISGAAGFFAARGDWENYVPAAVMGIVSDFSGKNEFMSHELLNLVDRTNQQYRIIVKSKVAPSDFSGLKAVLCADEEPPSPELRKQILAFVQAGGMLITGPKWGKIPGAPAKDGGHPGYALRVLGKGRVAVAQPDFEDPYLVANDSVVLISHRYELLRFWNGGAVGSYFTMEPSRKKALVHLLFYAFMFGNNKPTVRVAGKYATCKLWTVDQPAPQTIEMEPQSDAVELHLPPISQYAAVELET